MALVMDWSYVCLVLQIFLGVTNGLNDDPVWRISKAIQSPPRTLGIQDSLDTFPSVIFPEGYSKHEVPPRAENQPLRVNFSFYLSSILNVDEPNQVISLESTIRLKWFDSRISISVNESNGNLRFDDNFNESYYLFNRNPVDNLWFPDVFIAHAKELRMPVYQIPPLYLRIYQSGRMMYSARVNYDVSCPMKFEDYPVDIQHCDIEFESWGHTTDILKFFWIKNDVKSNENITLSQHTFYVELIDDDSSSSFSTGSFSKIKMRIHLVRQITFHALRTYLPSLFFILVAWFSMFVPLNHVPGNQTLDAVQVQKMSTKAKNPYRCSKFPLHKKFKLILEQNGSNKLYLK